MNDLPPNNQPLPSPPVGSMAKETAPIIENAETPIITEVGKETQLPEEVKKAGVTMLRDSVVLPQPVQQLGVKETEQSPIVKQPSVQLPLTDEKIAQGLKQSLTSSWRWLAQWCRRQTQVVLEKLYANRIR